MKVLIIGSGLAVSPIPPYSLENSTHAFVYLLLTSKIGTRARPGTETAEHLLQDFRAEGEIRIRGGIRGACT